MAISLGIGLGITMRGLSSSGSSSSQNWEDVPTKWEDTAFTWNGSVFNPAQPTALLEYYKFNEGSGTTLTDYSGNGRDGQLGPTGVSSPLWSGGGLQWTIGAGSGCAVQCPNIMSQVRTATFVIDVVRGQALGILLGCQQKPYFAIDNGDAMVSINNAQDHNGALSPASAEPVEGKIAITITLGTPPKIYYGGTEVACYTNQDTPFTPPATDDPMWLGNWPLYFLVNLPYIGKMYHALFYSTVLTPAEVASNAAGITSVMATRGITLGNTIPNRKVVAFVGDSQTDGSVSAVGFNGAYPDQAMAQLTNSYNWVNMGKGGAYITSQAIPDPLFTLYGQTPNVCVVWNAHFTAVSTATYIADLTSYCQARQAAGGTVIVATLADQGNLTVDQETDRQTICTWIRNNYLTIASRLMDIALDPFVGLPGSYAAHPTYFADEIHLTNLGYGRVASLCVVQLNSLGFT